MSAWLTAMDLSTEWRNQVGYGFYGFDHAEGATRFYPCPGVGEFDKNHVTEFLLGIVADSDAVLAFLKCTHPLIVVAIAVLDGKLVVGQIGLLYFGRYAG